MAGEGPAVIYLQNSGLGNIVNPILSLAHAEVYSIPIFLIVGWRGEPGVSDEPQHVKQGRSTVNQLDLMDIWWRRLDPLDDPIPVLENAWKQMIETDSPVAILIGKDTLAPAVTSYAKKRSNSSLLREKAISVILELINENDLVVATTGKTGREVNELRLAREESLADFLTVGGMGHALSISLGIARSKVQRKVICLDGDGAVLMHMGGLAIVGSEKPKNLTHVVLNNAAHESVGGQPTVAGKIDLKAIALGCGYEAYFHVGDERELIEAWKKMAVLSGPLFLEVDIAMGSRSGLGRPEFSPRENKLSFMEKISTTKASVSDVSENQN